jgi:16S rRNA (cytosine967-C5)-methyltransferase
MNQPNARNAALKILLRVNEQQGYSNLLLNSTLKELHLSVKDKAFAGSLVYGVLERQITLDYIIAHFSNRRLSEMEPVVRNALRLGAYQLIYLDKVPSSAAINETVNCVKVFGAAGAAGFTNAVLHAIDTSGRQIEFPPPKNWKTYLGTRYSAPQWLVRLWAHAYGRECCEELLKASFGRPPLTVRVNTQKCTAQALMEALSEEHVLAVTNPIVPNAIDLTSTGSIERLNAFQNGWFHVQDAASQLLCYAFGAKPGERIADVCSAPGGKSFTIAEQMCGEGSVDAFDLYSARVQLIQQGAERLGLQNIRTAERNAENGDAAPLYDRVLCDVPCSGLGILRRKPEIRLKSPETLDNLPSVQYCILVQSSQMVCPGGVLFYSTCTLNPAENDAIVSRFLNEHPDFSPMPLSLPPWIRRTADEPEHQITLMPHIHHTDGFFFAAFRKEFPAKN